MVTGLLHRFCRSKSRLPPDDSTKHLDAPKMSKKSVRPSQDPESTRDSAKHLEAPKMSKMSVRPSQDPESTRDSTKHLEAPKMSKKSLRLSENPEFDQPLVQEVNPVTTPKRSFASILSAQRKSDDKRSLARQYKLTRPSLMKSCSSYSSKNSRSPSVSSRRSDTHEIKKKALPHEIRAKSSTNFNTRRTDMRLQVEKPSYSPIAEEKRPRSLEPAARIESPESLTRSLSPVPRKKADAKRKGVKDRDERPNWVFACNSLSKSLSPQPEFRPHWYRIQVEKARSLSPWDRLYQDAESHKQRTEEYQRIVALYEKSHDISFKDGGESDDDDEFDRFMCLYDDGMNRADRMKYYTQHATDLVRQKDVSNTVTTQLKTLPKEQRTERVNALYERMYTTEISCHSPPPAEKKVEEKRITDKNRFENLYKDHFVREKQRDAFVNMQQKMVEEIETETLNAQKEKSRARLRKLRMRLGEDPDAPPNFECHFNPPKRSRPDEGREKNQVSKANNAKFNDFIRRMETNQHRIREKGEDRQQQKLMDDKALASTRHSSVAYTKTTKEERERIRRRLHERRRDFVETHEDREKPRRHINQTGAPWHERMFEAAKGQQAKRFAMEEERIRQEEVCEAVQEEVKRSKFDTTLSILRLSKPKKFEVAEKKEYKAPRTPAPPFVDRLYSCVSCQGPLESVKRVPPLGGITEKAPVRRQEKNKVQIEKYIDRARDGSRSPSPLCHLRKTPDTVPPPYYLRQQNGALMEQKMKEKAEIDAIQKKLFVELEAKTLRCRGCPSHLKGMPSTWNGKKRTYRKMEVVA